MNAAEKVVTSAIKKTWSELGSDPPCAQMLDGEWRYSPWGCDSLDHLRDELAARLAPLLEPEGLRAAAEAVVERQAGRARCTGRCTHWTCQDVRDIESLQRALRTPAVLEPEP